MDNILGSWKGARLLPFNPKKVLHRIEITLSPQSSPPSKMTTTSSLYDSLFLTSFPPDVNALQVANTALAEAVHPLRSPIQNYINRMNTRMEHLEARLIVLEKDKNEAESVLSHRAKRESGKRGILKDLYSVALQEVLKRVREEERKIKERKSKGKRKSTIGAMEPTKINEADA